MKGTYWMFWGLFGRETAKKLFLFIILSVGISIFCVAASEKTDSVSNSQLKARMELRSLGITFCTTAFFNAVYEGDIVVVKLFLASGISPCISGKFQGSQTNAVSLAISSGHCNIAKVLIDNGAAVNVPLGGTSPLDMAVLNGDVDFIKYLLKKGGTLSRTQRGKHYYKMFPSYFTWKASQELCKLIGGYLCSIESAEENDFIQQLADRDFVWIGGVKDNPQKPWRWVSGCPFKYTNWEPGQPDNSYGPENFMVMAPTGKWRDYPNDPGKYKLKDLSLKGFVCEWNK